MLGLSLFSGDIKSEEIVYCTEIGEQLDKWEPAREKYPKTTPSQTTQLLYQKGKHVKEHTIVKQRFQWSMSLWYAWP